MAQSVAVTKKAATRPSNPPPAITHDGMNETNSPPWPKGGLIARSTAADTTAGRARPHSIPQQRKTT